MSDTPNLDEEQTIIRKMIELMCHGKKHQRAEAILCADCADLSEYCCTRLARCPYGEDKPACGACKTHCYTPARRAQVKEVMRYAGPRILFHHPYITIHHFFVSVAHHKKANT